jgi:glucosyl-dolichyl phosphate glucuronosyltransferase
MKYNSETPYLSVLVLTHNRASLLEKALESLTMQTYPANLFEVVVVDNGSSDSTREVCDRFEQDILNFKYLYEPKLGLHNARHAGCKAAKGEILVYGDDDIRAFPTWLVGVAESFQEPTVALVGGKILPEFESEPPEWVSRLWGFTPWGKSLGYYSLIDFGDEVKEISPLYVYGCNFSIRKQILLDIGGFHPDSFPKELLKFRGDGESSVA